VEVLAEFAAPPNGIYAVFPQRKHLPVRLRLWIDFLKQHFGRPEFWDDIKKTRRLVMMQAHVIAVIPLVAVFFARGFGK
jgi:uncharacterized membrane protein